ncbi:MAG: hypothetical protein V7K40_27470 [Nostoc sp.]|uniref:hypothetical protein n=1 Tax=Nostoc sp. TaxID=1180 RepID=UPI002FF82C87
MNLIFPQIALADIKSQMLPLAQIQSQNESISTKAALERLFINKKIQSEWFAPDFLAQVTIEQVWQIIDGMKSQLEVYQGVQNNG